jgi:hypothetical protein
MNQEQQPGSDEQNAVREFLKDLLAGVKVTAWVG